MDFQGNIHPLMQRSFQFNPKIIEPKLLSRICFRSLELNQKPINCLVLWGYHELILSNSRDKVLSNPVLKIKKKQRVLEYFVSSQVIYWPWLSLCGSAGCDRVGRLRHTIKKWKDISYFFNISQYSWLEKTGREKRKWREREREGEREEGKKGERERLFYPYWHKLCG